MMRLASSIEKELETYKISFEEKQPALHFHDIQDLIRYAKERSGTDSASVAVSMLIRRYSFFVTAQFYMFSKHSLIWDGSVHDVGILDDAGDDNWLPEFLMKPNSWSRVSEEERFPLLQALLKKYGSNVLEPLSKEGKVPKLVLWENIWSYLVWMYDGLEGQEQDRDRAKKDVAILLGDEVWSSIERRSPFKRFIGDQTLQESMNPYKRVTCCLYCKIDGMPECAYCPNI